MPSPAAAIAHPRLAALQLPGTVWIGSRPADPIRYLSSGAAELDSLLGGGWARGKLSEIAGPLSSGRTALAHAALAAATRYGELAALVDAEDTLSPAFLEQIGTDLRRVLWVRPHSLKESLACTEVLLNGGGLGLVILDRDSRRLALSHFMFAPASPGRRTRPNGHGRGRLAQSDR